MSPSAAATVRAYWAAAEARDWDAFAATLAEDVVYELPQTRERIRGRAAYVQFNIEYPGDWHLALSRVVADDTGAATELDFRVDEESMTAVTFFTFDAAGRIRSVTDFWPESYDPPPGREHLVERF